jgi:hypothetical protein
MRIQSGDCLRTFFFTSPSATSASRAYTSSVAASACTQPCEPRHQNNGARYSRAPRNRQMWQSPQHSRITRHPRRGTPRAAAGPQPRCRRRPRLGGPAVGTRPGCPAAVAQPRAPRTRATAPGTPPAAGGAPCSRRPPC